MQRNSIGCNYIDTVSYRRSFISPEFLFHHNELSSGGNGEMQMNMHPIIDQSEEIYE